MANKEHSLRLYGCAIAIGLLAATCLFGGSVVRWNGSHSYVVEIVSGGVFFARMSPPPQPAIAPPPGWVTEWYGWWPEIKILPWVSFTGVLDFGVVFPLWPLMATALYLGWRDIRKANLREPSEPACVACGYTLLPTQTRCPECGSDVGAAPPSPPTSGPPSRSPDAAA